MDGRFRIERDSIKRGKEEYCNKLNANTERLNFGSPTDDIAVEQITRVLRIYLSPLPIHTVESRSKSVHSILTGTRWGPPDTYDWAEHDMMNFQKYMRNTLPGLRPFPNPNPNPVADPDAQPGADPDAQPGAEPVIVPETIDHITRIRDLLIETDIIPRAGDGLSRKTIFEAIAEYLYMQRAEKYDEEQFKGILGQRIKGDVALVSEGTVIAEWINDMMERFMDLLIKAHRTPHRSLPAHLRQRGQH